jgi:nitrite reductase/ring-hydroxylating ferredoxin subunit
MTTELWNDPDTGPSDLTRRGVIRGVAVAGLAAPLLAACGGDEEPTATGGDDQGGDPAAPGDELTSTADVPSGGGVVLAEQQVVVTQPADGDFKAFTAVCTHQGCIVAEVKDGTINCNCHGSRYNIEDGSVENGPATKGLTEVPITVDGDSITMS